MLDHLMKADMAREAERLLEDSDWLPEPMRTPILADALATEGNEPGEEAQSLPAFLDDDQVIDEGEDGDFAVAAE